LVSGSGSRFKSILSGSNPDTDLDQWCSVSRASWSGPTREEDDANLMAVLESCSRKLIPLRVKVKEELKRWKLW